MPLIAVVDYNMGNLRSVAKALEHVCSHTIRITSDPNLIDQADRVVFPGQGAIGDCMKSIDQRHLRDVIGKALKTKPFLGICMGLQVLMDYSEENGGCAGLSSFQGQVRRFPASTDEAGNFLKIPHMGWNQVWHQTPHPLWEGIKDGSRFYFVHSYFVEPSQSSWIAGMTQYGLEFTSVLAVDNVFATQFHPEKSQHDGLRLLKNFVEWQV